MSIRLSGALINLSGMKVTGEKSDVPQGTTLVDEYNAELGTLPTSQGWGNTGGGQGTIITDFDDRLTLRKSQGGLGYYNGSVLDPGWLLNFNIRVDSHSGLSYVHGVQVYDSQSQYPFTCEFYPDKIMMLRGSSYVLAAEYDLKSNYVDVIFLHNTDTGFVELYLDGTRYRDDIDDKSGSIIRSWWGDGSSFNGAGNNAFWRNIKFYNGWTI